MNPIGPTMPPALPTPTKEPPRKRMMPPAIPTLTQEPPRKSKAAPPAMMTSAPWPQRKRKKRQPPAASPERKKKKGDKSKRSCSEPPRPESEPEKKALPSRPSPRRRSAWTPEDEVRILEALAGHRRERGKVPTSQVLFFYLDGFLDRKGVGRRKIQDKMRSLKRRYDNDVIKGTVPAEEEEHECRLYHLSRNVWGDMPNTVTTSDGGRGATVHNTGKTFDEMRQSYLYLAQEVMFMVGEPAVLERVLPGIDESSALALDSKIKELRQELTNTINESARMQNIEVPKVWQYQCPSAELEPEKSRAESDNIFLRERFEKINGACIGTQEQIARVEHQMLELKEIFIASQSSPKILQSKVATQNKLPHGKNREVTSKYQSPHNISRRKILAQKSMPRARKENIDAESRILHDEVKQRKAVTRAWCGFSDDRNKEIRHGGIAGTVAPDQPSRPGQCHLAGAVPFCI